MDYDRIAHEMAEHQRTMIRRIWRRTYRAVRLARQGERDSIERLEGSLLRGAVRRDFRMAAAHSHEAQRRPIRLMIPVEVRLEAFKRSRRMAA